MELHSCQHNLYKLNAVQIDGKTYVICTCGYILKDVKPALVNAVPKVAIYPGCVVEGDYVRRRT
jgi:hypothetical protein